MAMWEGQFAKKPRISLPVHIRHAAMSVDGHEDPSVGTGTYRADPVHWNCKFWRRSGHVDYLVRFVTTTAALRGRRGPRNAGDATFCCFRAPAALPLFMWR